MNSGWRDATFSGVEKPGCLDLRIAGVTLRIACPPDVRLHIPDRLHRSFKARTAERGNDFILPIRLVESGFPSLANLKKKFDTEESWSMFQDSRYYWITFHPAQRMEPLWVARFDRKVSSVTVYCRVEPPGSKKGSPVLNLPVMYPLDQLLLMYFFSGRMGILAHAAGLILNKRTFIFAGASGAGKSTFSQLLAAAKVGKVLSDERMIVREIEGKMTAYGTPWAGTAGIARDGSAPLAGIFFLRHSQGRGMKKLAAAEIVDRLLPVLSIPWFDADTAAPVIAFAKRLAAKVPGYEMSFTPDGLAVDFFREFTKKMS